MIDFIVNYWWVLVIALAVVVVGGYFLYCFIKMPSTSQIAKVKEWLLYAVTQAEKELGGGTGQLKLRYVYDMFIAKFPHLAKIVSFDAFSGLVDEVLEKFREMLETNKNVQLYVEGSKDGGE